MSQISQFITTAQFIQTITGDVGLAVGPAVGGNVDITGAGGITVTGTPGTNSLVISYSGFVAWSREAGAAVALLDDHGYINTNVGLTTFTLPVTAELGTTITIVGESAAGWTIAQNAGQSIQYGNISSTVGVGGSVASSNRYDTIYIVCRVADVTWSVTSSIGVLNIT